MVQSIAWDKKWDRELGQTPVFQYKCKESIGRYHSPSGRAARPRMHVNGVGVS